MTELTCTLSESCDYYMVGIQSHLAQSSTNLQSKYLQSEYLQSKYLQSKYLLWLWHLAANPNLLLCKLSNLENLLYGIFLPSKMNNFPNTHYAFLGSITSGSFPFSS